jgi:transcription initiation factor TFIID subunit 9B
MSRTSTESLPPAARAIALLLASTPTVQDAQPGVLHQLLEFSHRYTAQVLADALVYADHAGRSNKVEMDDVTLAVQARVGWEFGGRVPKEVRFRFRFRPRPLVCANDDCHPHGFCPAAWLTG